MINGIQGLAKLGIDATLPSLPKFVVVGDQSHGKSSLVEALCKISLPRNEGTCTRCPFQITTTESRTWSCTVSLVVRWEYDATSKLKPFPRWKDTGEEQTLEFAIVEDRDELEETLRRAQFCILNPSMNPLDILRADEIDMRASQSHFSPNVVSVHIRGTDLPELSVYDLPGAINMAPSESEKDLVSLVENMLMRYLRDDKALVLLAASLSSDIDTSTAFKFVTQAKAIKRCMGVLTKPDLFVTQNPQKIKNILSNKEFKVGNGWYVTMQLSQQDLDQGTASYAEARTREETFFASQHPWKSHLQSFQDRFTIRNLQDALSHKLYEHIVDE